MNLGPAAGCDLAAGLAQGAESLHNSEVWIAPPALTIPAVAEKIQGTAIRLGAQNVHHEEKGAFTGELSVSMLKESSCEFAIVGHSERRTHFKESNEECAKRARGALAQGLTVIFCIGETLEERESGRTNEVLETQLSFLYENLPSEQFMQLVIAYEPVWAIGTGKVASVEQIAETHAGIDTYSSQKCNTSFPILYGGSVNPDNFAEIAPIAHVSGALVGGASLVAEKFLKLVEISEQVALG